MTNSESNEIFERIISGTHNSKDLGKLIEIMYSGRDLELLRLLLESDNELVLSDGAYILSEIGSSGKPLLPLALKLVFHRRKDVRYWAMNSVISCADSQTAKKVIEQAELLSDPWELTRWAARRFLDNYSG